MKALTSLLTRQVFQRHVSAASRSMLGISAQPTQHEDNPASSSVQCATSSAGHQQWLQQQQIHQQQLSSTSSAPHAAMFLMQGWLLSPQMQQAARSALQQHNRQLLCTSTELPGSSPVEESGCATPIADQAPGQGPMVCGKRGTTYQPSRRKRVNSHGLEKRLGMPGGRNALMRRLFKKKRARLTVDCFV